MFHHPTSWRSGSKRRIKDPIARVSAKGQSTRPCCSCCLLPCKTFCTVGCAFKFSGIRQAASEMCQRSKVVDIETCMIFYIGKYQLYTSTCISLCICPTISYICTYTGCHQGEWMTIDRSCRHLCRHESPTTILSWVAVRNATENLVFQKTLLQWKDFQLVLSTTIIHDIVWLCHIL